MKETLIQKKLRTGVKAKGGKALKFSSFYETKYPDRLILLPGGVARWVEAKTTGKVPDPGQEIRIAELRALGFKVDVIDDSKTLNDFLNDL